PRPGRDGALGSAAGRHYRLSARSGYVGGPMCRPAEISHRPMPDKTGFGRRSNHRPASHTAHDASADTTSTAASSTIADRSGEKPSLWMANAPAHAATWPRRIGHTVRMRAAKVSDMMTSMGSRVRPGWWSRLGVPVRCGGCQQPWLPGGVSLHWTSCSCPGADFGGHQVWACETTPGCRWEWWPDEHQ